MILWIAIATIGGIALLTGLILGYAAQLFKVEGNPVVKQVDNVLPQLQCAKCGYPGCLPYATAIVEAGATLDKCTPGGEATVLALARLLDRPTPRLNLQTPTETLRFKAVIKESDCIGCTLCIKACPVDAIVGAPKLMHTIIAAECTGCDLCVAPCPVNCIVMQPVTPETTTWKYPYPQRPIFGLTV